MKLLVWSATPSGTVWCSLDGAEGFSSFHPYKMSVSLASVHRPRILFWQHSRKSKAKPSALSTTSSTTELINSLHFRVNI